MKKLTKVLSLVLALALVLMSVNIVAVNADDSNKVTIEINSEMQGHQFYAYRIFKGDVDNDPSTMADNKNVLSNIAWDDAIYSISNDLRSSFIKYLKEGPQDIDGDGIVYPDYTNTIKDYADLINALDASSSSASDVAAAIAKMSDNSRAAEAIADAIADFFNDNSISAKNDVAPSYTAGKYTISGDDVSEGYYIIVDKAKASDTLAPSAVLLAVTETTTTIDIKASRTTVDKTIINSTKGAYSVGDEIEFQVDILIPEDVQYYSNYNITLVDTLTNLQYVDGSWSAQMVDGDDKHVINENIKDHFTEPVTGDSGGNQTLTINHKDYTVEYNAGSAPLGVTSDKVTTNHWDDHAGDIVRITYKAKLLPAAKTLDAKNNVEIEYVNNPSTGATSKTTDTVNVYTHGLQINKWDGEKSKAKALSGVKFDVKVYDSSSEDFIALDLNIDQPSGTISQFNWSGLGDGIYKITETPLAGYNNWDDDNIAYLVIKTVSTEGGVTAASTTATLYSEWDTGNKNVKADTQIGDPVQYTKGSSDTEGKFVIDVENYKGTILPETGGMGTKIFYTLGGVLVVGAVILLVVKRRMRAE